MKIISLIICILVVTLPGLWIESYNVTNPVFWTVFIGWFSGRILGYIEKTFEEN